jgi:putative ABC transport system substrate-binding protein
MRKVVTGPRSALEKGLDASIRERADRLHEGSPRQGGAISYGPDEAETSHRNAVQVAKILDGTKPGDLPVERPTNFNLVVNLKTAKALGLTISESVLLRADEVIR